MHVRVVERGEGALLAAGAASSGAGTSCCGWSLREEGGGRNENRGRGLLCTHIISKLRHGNSNNTVKLLGSLIEFCFRSL